MNLGLIVRADEGGLGVQTWEIARHVRPDRILIVNHQPPRGVFVPERFDGLAGEIRIGPHVPKPRDIQWLCDVDDVFTVEGCYNDGLIDVCASRQKRLTVLANPELFSARYRHAVEAGHMRVVLPTDWEAARLPFAEVLRMPVATDRITGQVRTREPRTLLHVSAPAFLDRHGTALLRKAIRRYDGPPITLLVSGPEAPGSPDATEEWRPGQAVTVEPLPGVRDYWDRYTDDIDALVVPRRYGGLSLVMQESAAAGLPIICLDRAPERGWGGTRRVPVCEMDEHPMRGGRFERVACDPAVLAATIRTHAESDPTLLSSSALRHADGISWDRLLPAWTTVLHAEGTVHA